MKIIISGKGGCGKSSIASLIAKEIAKRGRKVLVMDTDESNFGLHTQLGMESPPDFMDYFGGKEVLFEKVNDLEKGWKVTELPKEYMAERDNIRLLSMGKIYDFGEGCACPINELTSRFLENLELTSNEFLIADTDAGVEHLGRGVDKGCDLILVVVEPSQESLKLAKKITEMGESVDKNVRYLLNKVDDQTEKIISKSIEKSKTLASIPEDDRIFTYGLEGKELDFEVEGIEETVNYLTEKKYKEG